MGTATMTMAGLSSSDRGVGVEQLFRAHYTPLVRLARLLVDDLDQAEEVVQDAFVALHRQWHRADDPLAYLRTTVVNGARGRLRRRETARRHLRSTEPVLTTPPDDRAVLADEHRAVAAALSSLPERQRACVALRYYQGLTEAETAAVLGISTGSVKTHVHRAIETLGKRLEDLR
jgi:RNA polymerase sigma-70 factor (sigma-E family)